MEIRDESAGKDRTLAVSGEVDLESSPELLKRLQDALRSDASLTLDLRDVDYIDSSGIAVLVQGLKHARRRGTRFRLRAPSDRVRAVLDLAQLTSMFDIEEP